MQDLTTSNSLDIIYKSGNSNDCIAYKNGYVIRHGKISTDSYSCLDYATRNPGINTEMNKFLLYFDIPSRFRSKEKIEVWREYADCPNNIANEFIKLLDIKDVVDANSKEVILETPELGIFKGVDAIRFKSNIFAFNKDGIVYYKKSPDFFIAKTYVNGYNLRLMAEVGANRPIPLLMTPSFNCNQPEEIWDSYYKYLYKNFINLINL